MREIKPIELSELDLHYESHRLKDVKKEGRLLVSISNIGIREPLKGVSHGKTKVLLDGFKRLRCARRLNITTIPFLSLGNDEAMGIIELMRDSFGQKLNIIEEIKLIEELKTVHGLSITEIATHLGKSKAWVSVRADMHRKLTPVATKQILSGKFPARSYLYTILPFTRVNGIKSEKIDRFVNRVSGNQLSTREIKLLAQPYFNGSNEIGEQVDNGNLKWALECVKDDELSENNEGVSLEQSVLRGLKTIRSGMRVITQHGDDSALKSGDFFAQVNLLTTVILNETTTFLDTVRRLHDRSQ